MAEQFNRLLDEYKNQYLQFLSTGDDAAKRAYQATLDAIEAAISEKRESVDSEKRAMKHFAASYQADKDALEDTVARGQDVAQSAQDIMDDYQEAKARYDQALQRPAHVDLSVGYAVLARIGAFLLLLPLVLLAAYYSVSFVRSVPTPTPSLNLPSTPLIR